MVRAVGERLDPRPRGPLGHVRRGRCPTRSRPWCACSRPCTTTRATSPSLGCGRGHAAEPGLLRGAGCAPSPASWTGVSTIGSDSLLSRIWDQAVDHDHRHRRTHDRDLVQHPGAQGGGEGVLMRIAPDEIDTEAFDLLRTHLLEHAPWGAQVEVAFEEGGLGFPRPMRRARSTTRRGPPFHDAWGVEPVDIGCGRLDPLRRGLRGALPRRGDPRHRRRGPRRSCARGQRVPAPRGVREGLSGPRPRSSRGSARCRGRTGHEPGRLRRAGLPRADTAYIPDRITSDGSSDWPVEPGPLTAWWSPGPVRGPTARSSCAGSWGWRTRSRWGSAARRTTPTRGPSTSTQAGSTPSWGSRGSRTPTRLATPGYPKGHHRAGDRRRPERVRGDQRLPGHDARTSPRSGASTTATGRPTSTPRATARRSTRSTGASTPR